MACSLAACSQTRNPGAPDGHSPLNANGPELPVKPVTDPAASSATTDPANAANNTTIANSTHARPTRSGETQDEPGGANLAMPTSSGAGSDTDRLHLLRQTRSAGRAGYDFTIGPGDVVQISVPAIEQLKDRTVRVSGDNTIGLPLVGVMSVGGMTEQQLRDALTFSLERYMYHPQVDVFVKEYRTRQIAISGAVKNPGVYTLASPSDTILEMISRAGGMTDDAAQRIILIPGASTHDTSPQVAAESQGGSMSMGAADPPQVASLSPVLPDLASRQSHGEMGSAPAVLNGEGNVAPVAISLRDVNSQKALDLPARPGDVVIVPPAGQVVVQGWVQTPGAYKITPGMTALGAVGAAGGAMFSHSAEILRTGPGGQGVELPVDLSDGQNGNNAALPVEAGDVVIVQRSVAGSVPYLVYSVFSKFGSGLYIPVP